MPQGQAHEALLGLGFRVWSLLLQNFNRSIILADTLLYFGVLRQGPRIVVKVLSWGGWNEAPHILHILPLKGLYIYIYIYRGFLTKSRYVVHADPSHTGLPAPWARLWRELLKNEEIPSLFRV